MFIWSIYIDVLEIYCDNYQGYDDENSDSDGLNVYTKCSFKIMIC